MSNNKEEIEDKETENDELVITNIQTLTI